MKTVMTLGLMFGFVALSIGEDKVSPAAKFDAEKLVGSWKVTGGKKAGTEINEEAKKGLYVFTKDKISIKDGDKEMFGMKYTLDTKASPVAIDMEITVSPGDSFNGKKGVGIIELDGDTFKICYDPEGKTRPTKFADDKAYSFVLKRDKEEKK